MKRLRCAALDCIKEGDLLIVTRYDGKLMVAPMISAKLDREKAAVFAGVVIRRMKRVLKKGRHE